MHNLFFIILIALTYSCKKDKEIPMQAITFEKTWGGTGNDDASKIFQKTDGNYIISGNTQNNSIGQVDAYLAELDFEGNIIWEKRYGGVHIDFANDVKQTSDEGYIVAGMKDRINFDGTMYIFKTNETGNLLWEHTYVSPVPYQESCALTVDECKDGGYIIAGTATVIGFEATKIILVRLDKDGNLLWEKLYEDDDVEFNSAEEVIVNKNGDFTILSSKDGVTSLFKVDENGELIWEQAYPKVGYSFTHSFVLTDEGNYIISSSHRGSTQGERDIRIIIADNVGNLISEQAIDLGKDDSGLDLQLVAGGAFVLTALSLETDFSSSDIIIIKLNQNGDIDWQNSFPRTTLDFAVSIDNTLDGGYILFNTNGVDTPNRQFNLIKTDENGAL